jgi:hypothetical protein
MSSSCWAAKMTMMRNHMIRVHLERVEMTLTHLA